VIGKKRNQHLVGTKKNMCGVGIRLSAECKDWLIQVRGRIKKLAN